MEVEESGKTLKDGLNNVNNQFIQESRADKKRKPWMTPEILKLIDIEIRREAITIIHKLIA